MKNILTLTLAVLIITSAIANAQTLNLDSVLTTIKSKYSVIGMSVTITKSDSVIFSEGYGKRDIIRDLPVNTQTKYRIASISKMIAATALMKLYEQGQFSLNDDVNDYLNFSLRNPNFSNQSITIKQILSHTSSLRDGSGYSSFLSATYNQDPPPNIDKLLTNSGSYYTSNMFSSSKGPNAKYFTYANINYGIVGTLIERISGKRFDIYCKENVFDPLNLNCSFNIQDLPDINDLSVLYRKSGGQWVAQTDDYRGVYPPPRDLSNYTIGNNGIIFAPQGGLRASNNDLAAILLAHMSYGTAVLHDSTLSRMHEIIWSYNGSNGNNYYGIFNNYALGNHTTSDLLPGEQLSGHPGEAYGLISDMYFSKINDYGIIFMTNGGLWSGGSYSGWYNIEEEIFTSCFDYISQLPSGFDDMDLSLSDFVLFQNFPNPFNPETTIRFFVPHKEHVKIFIYDTTGKKVAQLLDQIVLSGYHEIRLNAVDLSSGVYFYSMTAGKFGQVRKTIVMK